MQIINDGKVAVFDTIKKLGAVVQVGEERMRTYDDKYMEHFIEGNLQEAIARELTGSITVDTWYDFRTFSNTYRATLYTIPDIEAHQKAVQDAITNAYLRGLADRKSENLFFEQMNITKNPEDLR